MRAWLLLVAAVAVVSGVESAGAGAARLVCYVENARGLDSFSECTHLVYAGDARGDKLDALLKEYRKSNPRLKIVLRVADSDKDVRSLVKSKHVQGLEIHNAHKALNKTKVLETVEAARAAVTSSGGGPLFLALPAHPELLAKYYDLRALMKKVDLMMVQTHALGMVKKMTYHPSRLSGVWDMMNTDSVVDLVVGLGVPSSKIVISLPATARQFALVNETLSTPGSPTQDDEPKEIDQAELCRQLRRGRWTLERDQDLSAPYAFKNKTWISFEDSSSVDVKGKYARIRGLAGLALHQAERDVETPCGPTLKASLAKVLNQQSRAPRAAVLRSLENEILSAPGHQRALDALQVSPYRITQVVDSDGVIHSIREDTRTEFSCSRQGYFVHPRSCARFYRCVKFDQLSPEYTVFEFDCPAGLAFDSRYEVCVWPGSLPHTQACPGSSEIAPVPKTRFICPEHEGYYADPENCRWFFACLDHGKAPLTAYEFRCPFGLGFDAARLKCDWPWLVPACGNIARYEAEAYGFSAATLTGAAGFHGQTADDVNVAAHQSLVSGAALDNLVGIQSGFLSQADTLDSNFIASHELASGGLGGGHGFEISHGSNGFGSGQAVAYDGAQASNGISYQVGDAASLNGNVGLVQPTQYTQGGRKYSSGSLILDDYRLPTQDEINKHAAQRISAAEAALSKGYNGARVTGSAYAAGSSGLSQKAAQYQNNNYDDDNSGAYVHDPSGDYAEPYRHQDSPAAPYVHDGSPYKHTGDHYDTGKYSGSSEGAYETGKYNGGDSYDSGKYTGSSQGNYETGKYSGSAENGASSSSSSSQTIHDSSKYVASSGSGYDSGSTVNGYGSDKYKGSSQIVHDSGISFEGGYDSNKYSGSSGIGYESGKYNAASQIVHDSGKYFASLGSYSGLTQNGYGVRTGGQYVEDNSGQYVHDNSGAYVEANSRGYTDNSYSGGYDGSYRVDYSGNNGYKGAYSSIGAYGESGYSGNGVYNADNSGAYKHDDAGKYPAGVYRADGHIGVGKQAANTVDYQQYHGYSEANAGNYINNQKAYSGASHTLTAGAINVGLVGKTTLVDVNYNNQNNYQGANAQSYSHSTQTLHPAQVSYVAQPAVSISHVGTDENNLDGYSYITTPTSSGIPTTATPFAVTTAIPSVTTYKTSFIPETPKTSIKQVFGVSQPGITYVRPTVVAVKQVTPQVQVTNHNQGNDYQFESKAFPGSSNSENSKTYSGYDYSKPSIKFEDGVSYTTAAPAISVSTFKPQSFGSSQQTLHQVETGGYQYSTLSPVSEEPFKKIVAYTTGAPVSTFSQPKLSTYHQSVPQAFSHQTIHKVESSKIYTPSIESASVNVGYDYANSGATYQEPKIVQYTTAQPAVTVQPVVTTYQPQVFSQQTLHKVDASRVNTYSGESSGYNYEKPAIKFEEVKTVYSTPAPVVTSTYRPKSYHHQTIHKVESQNYVPVSSTPKIEYTYHSTPVTVYENPILKYTQKFTPITYVQPTTYKPQVFSHQTIHKSQDSKTYAGNGIQYTQSAVTYEQPKAVEYTTAQPIVVTSYKPQVFSQQTLHNVDSSQVNTYSQGSGYEYNKPAIKFVETPGTVVEYSTAAPIVTSTYKPHSYSHQTFHKVETPNYVSVSKTAAPQVDLSYQKSVKTYQNPFLKYTNKVTPVTYVQPTEAVYTQTYKPLVQQHQVSHVVSRPQYEQNAQISQEGYSYSQPEIQRNIDTNNAKSYSDASVVSHQYYHQSTSNLDSNAGKDVVFVSTTPSTLIYEYHYKDYESPKVETYKAPEYVPPKTDYKSYSIASTSAPFVQKNSVVHQIPEYVTPKTYSTSGFSTPIIQQSSFIQQTQDDYDYKPVEYSQQFDTVQKQVSYSTSHVEQPKVESVHFSFPSSTATTTFQQAGFQSPEIQVAYKSEEYLPPVVSTTAPTVTSYRPRAYSTVSSNREYLPPAEPTYQKYSTPSSTVRTIVKSTTPSYRTKSTTAYQATEYLPPANNNVVSFENFGYNEASIVGNPYQEYTVSHDTASVVAKTGAPIRRKPNIVVETAKSNLLGFGTVGPDAGLLSQVTYTTAAPVVSSTYRQRVKSTTPTYRYQSTTEYEAPKYLPPSEDTQSQINVDNFGYKNVESKIQYNPYQESTRASVQRKQNIVVETAKSNNHLGFGTVGPDAGFVSPVSYTTSSPIVISSTESYSLSPKTVSSTYAPVEQGLFEVTPSTTPLRRTKPKVAVVTKINDFNPFLVRKLGAVCSCQSPVLILKGKRPTQAPQDLGDFNDYDDLGRGDVNYDSGFTQESTRIKTLDINNAPAIPTVTSTFNPIIVPDDSYYQDYQDQGNYEVAVTPKHENYVSSTPAVTLIAQKSPRIRQRVKTVTAAPTYKTVLLNQEVAPTASIQESDTVTSLDSQAFDRYGPGGWRSRDETLQGSVDCKRAGLFRHPKQCNKFYACRWDCTKQRFTLHVFNCPIQLSFDPSIGACNWPSQGPACQGDTLLTNVL